MHPGADEKVALPDNVLDLALVVGASSQPEFAFVSALEPLVNSCADGGITFRAYTNNVRYQEYRSTFLFDQEPDEIIDQFVVAHPEAEHVIPVVAAQRQQTTHVQAYQP